MFSNLISRLPAIAAWLHGIAPDAQLTADSRRINAGDIFLAYAGDEADGRRFIADAVKRGAAAVLFDDEDGFGWNEAWDVENMGVSGLRNASGFLASAWYGRPDDGMFTVAVTGTNGKTSCTQWLGNALSQDGVATAVVGTLGAGLFVNGVHDGLTETGYTTPDAVMLQRTLAALRQRGAGALAIEASSIGLEQGRLNGMHVDLALFTNFTRDHLDYHLDMDAYEAAKAMLFDWSGLRHAVINLDDAMGLRLLRRVKANSAKAGPGRSINLVGYSVENQNITAMAGISMLRAADIRSSHAGTTFMLHADFNGQQHSSPVRTQLVGRFNVSNVLGVAATLLCKGLAFATVIDLLEALRAVPGRMQQLGGEEAPLVVIDYAHTPDAIEKTLTVLRDVARQRSGQLWCLFGCGGERDPGKRPLMAIAASAADHVVVTSDNPRGENANAIIEQIVQGFAISNLHAPHGAGHGDVIPQVIEDRAAAILWAVKHAARNDVVLLAGKGHESTQEIHGKKRPFLDADHALLALSARATMGAAK
ncbi:MAG: UDP-N-acetylmuramoyl-L-alanyl-D-glutamate--2,6-diaminopimelate ligase [Janthinobacterium lividum]